MTAHEHVRVAIIGSGFGGLGAAVTLRRMGITDLVVLERAGAVGGTWRENTYPGCACDVPSHLYSFSFAPYPRWPRTFAGQPEIRAYLEWVTDTFGLRPHIRFHCEATALRWDGEALHWVIDTPRGTLTADVVVSATGPLSEPKLPRIPGLEDFPGPVFHSARWDHEHSLRGKRVAVVGTGASAVQIVPEIAREVTHLTVYQRTPPWVIPRADRRVTELEKWLHARLPLTAAARRGLLRGIRELQVGAFARHPGQLRVLELLARRHLRRAVRDPALRRELTPSYRIGCKRILLSDDWYPTLVRPHVDLIASGLREVRGSTLVAEDGRETEADALVLATGFRVTEMPIAHRITGARGTTLARELPRAGGALRGTTAPGFPNLLVIIGPNTGLGNSSMLLMIEAQLAYLASFMTRLNALQAQDGREGRDGQNGRAALAPRPEAAMAWNARLQRRLARSVWNSGGCTSWYLDAQGRNTTMWPGTTGEFRRVTREVDPGEYEVLWAAAREGLLL